MMCPAEPRLRYAQCHTLKNNFHLTWLQLVFNSRSL